MTDRWTIPDVAAHLGVERSTVRAYRARRQMPEADGRTGRTPWWHPETIRAWRPKEDNAHRERVLRHAAKAKVEWSRTLELLAGEDEK